MTFPHAASLWDVAVAFGLLRVTGHVAYFANSPETVLTFGEHLCKEGSWSLQDSVIVSTEKLRLAYIAARAR